MTSSNGHPVPAPPAMPGRPAVPGPPASHPDHPDAGAETRGDDTDTLDGLADRSLAEHADVFEQIHAELQADLAGIDHA